MIIKGERISGTPMLIKSNGEGIQPQRMGFQEKVFDEDWVQELIHDHPELLPVSDIEPVFAPLIAIGREFQTNAGPIDNLFISPNGYITIVETKLWRNPESRRQVVGQIIDYAKELSGWTYEQLDLSVRKFSTKYRGDNKLGIVELINASGISGVIPEKDIIDNISRNLDKGRFLLLIVGDGIREDVESMVEYLNQTPQLHYSLAMVELQAYALETEENPAILIVPQLILRTRDCLLYTSPSPRDRS